MDDGFKKIDLPRETIKSVDNDISRRKNMARRKKKASLIIGPLVALLLIIIGLAAAIIIPGRAFLNSTKKLQDSAKELSAAIKNQDLTLAQEKIKITKTHLLDTKKRASYLAWTGFIPVVGNYYRDLNHGLNAGDAGLDALDVSLQAIAPYADLLGLKGKGTFVGGSADARLQTAITTLDKVTPRLADISVKVQVVQQEIDKIDPSRYPEKFNNQEIQSRIKEAKILVDTTSKLFISARPLLEELPRIMGNPKAKKYLVLFKNDKELRPDGGFITAYAIFRVENGKPVVEKADDIYKLDDSRTKKTPAPPEILKYHKNVFEYHLRDSNLSPDFSQSLKNFEQLYADVPDKISYDGVLTVDTHVLVEAIKILGTFVVYDRTFSADIDPRCNCPKVVYELEDYSTKPVQYVRADRKDIIGKLLLQIMQKALGVSPSQYWGRLFAMGIQELNEKHILIHLNDAKAQESIEALNWGGRIQDFTGDYLHINDANMAGAKSNLFVKPSVKIEYTTKNDAVSKKITITYKNPAPASNCNLEAGQLCLNGLLRNWVRIYTPKGSTLTSFKGSEMDPVVKEDLGKTVFEGFLTVAPMGSSQIMVEYTLPKGLVQNNMLPVLIQKQPGTDNNAYEIYVNGKLKQRFELKTDQVLSLNI